jgi:alanine racemase
MASSRAIVNLSAYADNLAFVRERIPAGCGIIPVVKADAYGHGIEPIARRATAFGVAMLGVATIEEAVELRQAGIDTAILVMAQPPRDMLAPLIEHSLRPMICDVATAERLNELARHAKTIVPVHCKVDTGMGRQGFDPDSVIAEMRHLMHLSHIGIEGIATHFPVADVPDEEFTHAQVRLFRNLLRQLDEEGVPYEATHAANSGAIVNYPEAAFDFVRPGLITYGIWPGGQVPGDARIRPVLRWETQVTAIKNIRAGATVGYGRTYTFTHSGRIAVLPVGYADGYKFALSNCGEVLIRGRRCPVRGRVSMGQIVVDVTEVPKASVGDIATLIGCDGDETITAEYLARLANTIPYDILTGIGRHVARVYVENAGTRTVCTT